MAKKPNGDKTIELRIGNMKVRVKPESEEKAKKFWERIRKKMKGISQKIRLTRGRAYLRFISNKKRIR